MESIRALGILVRGTFLFPANCTHIRTDVTCLTMPTFSADFYESILEASERGELWGIENKDLSPIEINLNYSHTRN